MTGSLSVVGVLLCMVAVLGIAPAGAAAGSDARVSALNSPSPAPLTLEDVAPFLNPGQRVPVEGGRRINVVCRGHGSPTVILEAGATNSSLTWAKVFGPISALTRVCAYDRAGYWHSDPNDRPSTAANIVDDLHRALSGAAIRPPYVLVGHSAGGLYATLFTDLHLDEVAGMVLVDPGFAEEHLDDQMFLTAADLASMVKQNTDFRALLTECVKLAKAHADAATMAARQCPCGPRGNDPAALIARMNRYCTSPKKYEEVLAEDAAYNTRHGLSASDKEELAAARSFGSIPLTVLTNSDGYHQAVSPQTQVEQTMASRGGHVVLSSRSSRGKVVLVGGSTHSIQLSRPDAVIAAVREVVDDVRLNFKLKSP